MLQIHIRLNFRLYRAAASNSALELDGSAGPNVGPRLPAVRGRRGLGGAARELGGAARELGEAIAARMQLRVL